MPAGSVSVPAEGSLHVAPMHCANALKELQCGLLPRLVAVHPSISTTRCRQVVWRCNTRFPLPTTPRHPALQGAHCPLPTGSV